MALKQMAHDSFATAVEVLNKFPCAVTEQDITRAGEDAIIAMYNGKGTLDSLTYQTFCKKVLISNKVLEAKSLPPSSAAAKYHTMRFITKCLNGKEKLLAHWNRAGRTTKEG